MCGPVARPRRVVRAQQSDGAGDGPEALDLWQEHNGRLDVLVTDIVMPGGVKMNVKDMEKPALVMNDLKSGVQKGRVALYVLTGATYFSNFEVRETPAAPWERHSPPMPTDTLTKWSLSPSYDALARNLERPLSPSERSRTRRCSTSAAASRAT